MNRWTRMAVSGQIVESDGVPWIEWAASPWIVGTSAVAATVISWALYRADRKRVGVRRGVILTVLRTVALLGFVAVWGVRGVSSTASAPRRPVLVLAIDDSTSMSLPSPRPGNASRTRLEHCGEVLTAQRLASLAERYDLRVTRLPGAVSRAQDDVDLALPLEARAAGSDWNRFYRDEWARIPRDRWAGWMLVSDGHANGARSPSVLARALEALGVPSLVVGVGPFGAAGSIGDGATVAANPIGEVLGPARAWAGTTVDIDVALGARSGGGTVEILDGERVIGSTSVEADSRGDRVTVDVTPEATGPREWTIRWRPHDESPAAAASASGPTHAIEIIDRTSHVWLIDGSPRWEHRYLTSLFERDDRTQVRSFIVTQGTGGGALAADTHPLDGIDDVDVFVLGDVRPDAIDRDVTQSISKRVRTGGRTLVVVAGPRSMPDAWSSTALAPLLPVRIDRGRSVGTRASILTWRLTSEGASFRPARLVSSRTQNAELWSVLPGPHWHVAAPPLDGATVLAQGFDHRTPSSDAAPLITSRPYGRGQVLFIATDETWRWRYHYGDRFPDRFWRRAIEWALVESVPGEGSFGLRADRSHAHPRDRIRLDAFDEVSTGDAALVRVVALSVDEETPTPLLHQSLARVPGGAGRFRGAVDMETLRDSLPSAVAPGTSSIRCRAWLLSAESEPVASTEWTLHLPRTDEENDTPSDEATLRDFARAAGGNYVRLEALDAPGRVEELLPPGPATEERRSTRRPIDSPRSLVTVLASLLVLEWVLRKRWRLA